MTLSSDLVQTSFSLEFWSQWVSKLSAPCICAVVPIMLLFNCVTRPTPELINPKFSSLFSIANELDWTLRQRFWFVIDVWTCRSKACHQAVWLLRSLRPALTHTTAASILRYKQPHNSCPLLARLVIYVCPSVFTGWSIGLHYLPSLKCIILTLLPLRSSIWPLNF